MKKLLLVLCLTTLASTVLQAQSLTAEDRAKAIKYLEKTRAGVLDATKGLSEAQWNFKPATNRWSVAEVTEHIAASEGIMLAMVQEQVMNGPARSGAEDVKAIDELILKAVPDRSRKSQTTAELQPTNRFGSPKDSLKRFEEDRAKTIEFAKDAKALREHTMDSPMGKKLDGYQWLLFLSAHSERHTKQIEEVKADPKFPKK